MKISLAIFLAIGAFTLPTLGADYQFEIPGVFFVSVHGTLYVSAPDGWSMTNAYSEQDIPTNTPPPRFPGQLIKAKNISGAEINVIPMSVQERSAINYVNERMDKGRDGTPLPRTPIQGPYAKGSICYLDPARRSRAHGDLETGNLLLSFVVTLSDTNDWPNVQSILKSFRFEENESVQQSGAGYPPQGVGSPDP